jgi:hypothetical protein
MRRLALVVLLVPVLAGCGGDSSSSEDFTADANRICREAAAEVAEVARETPRSGDPQAAAADVLERGVAVYEPYMDRLRALEAPEDLRADWDAFLDRVQQAFDLFPRLAAATRTRDRRELSELAGRFTQIAGDTRPFAERQGLEDCLPRQG